MKILSIKSLKSYLSTWWNWTISNIFMSLTKRWIGLNGTNTQWKKWKKTAILENLKLKGTGFRNENNKCFWWDEWCQAALNSRINFSLNNVSHFWMISKVRNNICGPKNYLAFILLLSLGIMERRDIPLERRQNLFVFRFFCFDSSSLGYFLFAP